MTIQRNKNVIPDRKFNSTADLYYFFLQLKPQTYDELVFLLNFYNNAGDLPAMEVTVDEMAQRLWAYWNWKPDTGDMVTYQNEQYPVVRRSGSTLTILINNQTQDIDLCKCIPA